MINNFKQSKFRSRLLVLVGLVVAVYHVQAQFKQLTSFDKALYEIYGYHPYGALTVNGRHLYGMTSAGGAYDHGVVFQMYTNGGHTILHDFNSSGSYGSLTLIGTKLYGMSGDGVFKINIDGSGYTVLNTNINGSYGSLIASDSTLYGMTYSRIFKIKTDGTEFATLHIFAGSPDDGIGAYGPLTLVGDKLYGTTFYGSCCVNNYNDNGVVFCVNTNGSGYTILHNFLLPPYDGANPKGSLTVSGTKLYGTTEYGGTNSQKYVGVIFSMNMDGSGYTILHNFGAETDGAHPSGSLTLSGEHLFGTTSAGGTHGNGTIFKINTDGSGYAVLYNFGSSLYSSEGIAPNGSLALSDRVLYGMTSSDGAFGGGTAFSYQLVAITTPSPLPNGSIGAPYNQTLMAIGGVYSWSVVSNSLPPGLGLVASSGAITGTPTIVTTSNFIVQVMDANGIIDTRLFSLTTQLAPVITTSSPLPTGQVGIAYNYTLTAAGGIPPYIWSGTLPAGLGVSSTGMITGTPTVAVSSNFTIRVADLNGLSSTKDLYLKIDAIAPTITTDSLPEAFVGTAYNYTMMATGGALPYSWRSGIAPYLLAGLTLSTNGVWSGTPTETTTAIFSISVAGSDSLESDKVFMLKVNPATNAPSITTSSPLPPGAVGVAYSQTLMASGGAKPYSWSVVSNNLPAGLSLLASSGAITGTPTVATTANFTVQVRGSGGLYSTKVFKLSIALTEPTITTSSLLPSGKVGIVYNQPLTATGGITPYGWLVVSNTLPPGLNLNSAGVIGGTPSATGVVIFRARVTDSIGLVSEKNLSCTISPTITTPPIVTNATDVVNGLPVVILGDSFGFNVGATNGGSSAMTYQWDFGDGGTSTNMNPSHVFTNCGPAEVTVSVSDGLVTTSSGFVVSVACPFDQSVNPVNLKMKSNFAPGKFDTASLKGVLNLPLGVTMTNFATQLSIGSVDVPFTLDSKGKGMNGYSSVKFSRKGKPVGSNQLWQVSAKFKGDFDALWAADGLANTNVLNQPLTMPVLLLLDTDPPESFYIEKPVLYNATQGKSGSAK
jgi:uncharacterized repeat protein (TIGR03803 family)